MPERNTRNESTFIMKRTGKSARRQDIQVVIIVRSVARDLRG
jgi:hypothetical protein